MFLAELLYVIALKGGEAMLEYELDISDRSQTLLFSADENARLFSLYATEIGYYRAKPGYFTRRDGKAQALLIYTCSGKGVLHWKNQVCSLTAGTAVVIYCDTFQQYYTGDADEWEFYWVHFNGEGLRGYAASLMDRLTPVRLRAVGEMEDAFRRILSLRTDSDILSRAEINSLLNGMLLGMLNSLYQAETEEARGHAEVRLLTKYIHEHMLEDIGMADFERVTHYSKYYLIHIFRQQIGVPPYRYLHQCRIHRAQELLRSTTDAVAEIGAQVGYIDTVSFIRHFQSIVGTTPAKYRKESIRLRPEKMT